MSNKTAFFVRIQSTDPSLKPVHTTFIAGATWQLHDKIKNFVNTLDGEPSELYYRVVDQKPMKQATGSYSGGW